MGIESDRMVFDYLSEVGDLAQQRQLPPGDRSALVAGLRGEIDRRRTTRGEESPAAVRGILGDLGTPDEVVERAAGGDGAAARKRADWWSDRAPDPAPAPAASAPAASAPDPAPDPAAPPAPAPVPHPRGWWHAETDDGDLLVPGFVGGVEAPELFRPPDPEPPEKETPGETGRPAPGRRSLTRLLRRRRPQEPEAAPEPEAEAPARRVAHPFLLLAALLLIAGAAFGWLPALALGWLIAYGSRRLTPAQVKTAVFVLPGLAAAGGVTWLWGRVRGRWGDAVPEGAMNTALSDTWPWTLRAAALLSALYLLLRARRG
ncbi:hypothetical protein ACFVU3_33070 [Streptomyces sp. NPDC058052]|uniref:hypothetical protein n=1 Tax=Streptomyces sp. NPDC058052 TaxID=3346316 RepID=UPI0036E492BF